MAATLRSLFVRFACPMRLALPAPHPARTAPRLRRRPASVEAGVVAACIGFVALNNGAFWQAALADRPASLPGTWRFALCVAIALVALHVALIAPWVTRRTVRPVLGLLFIGNALASHFMARYGTVLDPDMLRNVLHTDWKEARELVTPELLAPLLLQALPPLVLLALWQPTERPWASAARRRIALVTAAALLTVGSLWAVFQDVSALMRNHKPVRYLVTPANYVYGVTRNLVAPATPAASARLVVAPDAKPGPSWATQAKPRLVVLVVGETARAANWGLDGYERQTTPELAALAGLVNFRDVTSCGTHTEASVPCMFSPFGRRRYDESAIRRHESLLHVLARIGVGVLWRDNQSGCKGVCDGLPTQSVAADTTAGLCREGLCLDEELLHGLAGELQDAHGNRLVVLHQLGNHGPAYFKRYPAAYRRHLPACETGELSRCSREEIVNAYDNAIGYTDHFLAETVRFLQSQSARYDTALVYVSDHGESLGEHQLYLHGMPYALAPEVQTHVPMVMWLSDGFKANAGIDAVCLRARADRPASHDHLFHTLLGLLDVETATYERTMDLTGDCRTAPEAAGPMSPALDARREPEPARVRQRTAS